MEATKTTTSAVLGAVSVPAGQEDEDGDDLVDRFLEIELGLAAALAALDYSGTKVTHVSNPLRHAIVPHTEFVRKYLGGSPAGSGQRQKKYLFLGMNPGPWGMCQTGVPFGEVEICKTWLSISGHVDVHVTPQHPKRPIQGFNCTRREVSGERFWGFFRSVCGKPENFFRHCFVYNHCPLAFMTVSGKNVTPPELRPTAGGRAVDDNVRSQILALCDAALLEICSLLRVEVVVCVGKFAYERATWLVKRQSLQVKKVVLLMHPSPINPAANRGWQEIAQRTLQEADILRDLSPNS